MGFIILALILIIEFRSGSAQFFQPPAPFGKAQKPFGKYCGILQEIDSLDKIRVYNCRGAVWALDENRLYIDGFSFQPSILRPENITFWIGPAKEPPRFSDEIIPSDNGIYLEPKELPLQTFLIRNNTFKIAKKPSTQQIEPLLSLLASAAAKKANSTLNRATANLKDNKSSKISTSKSGSKNGKDQKSEPHPTSEPEPSPSKRGKSIEKKESATAEHNGKLELSIDRIDGHPDQSKSSHEQGSNRSVDIDSHLSNFVSINNRSYTDDWWNDTLGIDLIVGGGATIKVTRPYARKWRVTTIIPALLIDQNGNETIKLLNTFDNGTSNTSDSDNWTSATLTSRKAVAVTPVSSQKMSRKLKPLSWYAGAQPLILEIPKSRHLSEFRWLTVWDHTNHLPVATLLFPSGPGFSIPRPHILNGFKAALSKDVRSGPIEIVDTKTIRVHDFHFEGDAPGAWFYVGKSLIPVANGEILPIREDGGTHNCDFLEAYDNQTLTLKLPGDMEVTDIFWLSVFCLPYGISFAHVYLPYKDLNVPTSMDFQSVPRCMLES